MTAATAELSAFGIYRTDEMPGYATNRLGLRACDASLLTTLGATIRQGAFLNGATSRYPAAVLGYQAATALGIAHLAGAARIWVRDPGGITGRWLTVVGILDPVPLASELDNSVVVGFPVARQVFGYDGHPSRIYAVAGCYPALRAARLAPTDARRGT